jgi:hypothetical protein
MLKVHIEGHEFVPREVKHCRTVACVLVPVLNNFKIVIDVMAQNNVRGKMVNDRNVSCEQPITEISCIV